MSSYQRTVEGIIEWDIGILAQRLLLKSLPH